MNIVSNIHEWQDIRRQLSLKAIGFVATMGHLHDGHISLCRQSQSENDLTVVSIFINPTQFSHALDYDHYPNTLEQDIDLLSSANIDYLLLPEITSIYPDHYQFQLHETELSLLLEGEYRPGHFQGVLTVVLKLLNLIQPSKAYFGEKDYQQFLLIKNMVNALFIPTKVIACKTVRASDGLALSSRNSRLNVKQRKLAKHFPQLLQQKRKTNNIIAELTELGFKVDYIVDRWERRLGAVWLDEIRLIDNFQLDQLKGK